MKIALGADSVGKPLLDVVISHLKDRPGVVADDLSTRGLYADVADRVASSVLSGDHDRAILFCGTASGFASAPTRFQESARLSRTTPIRRSGPPSPTTRRS